LSFLIYKQKYKLFLYIKILEQKKADNMPAFQKQKKEIIFSDSRLSAHSFIVAIILAPCQRFIDYLLIF